MDNLLKKSRLTVYQVIGLDKNNISKYSVLKSYKDAKEYVELQTELNQCQIVPIRVYEVKKR